MLDQILAKTNFWFENNNLYLLENSNTQRHEKVKFPLPIQKCISKKDMNLKVPQSGAILNQVKNFQNQIMKQSKSSKKSIFFNNWARYY